MNEEKRNLPDRRRSHNRERPEAAFCEELLCCYTCGKIYFTRHPIRLRTAGRRSLHVCLGCSRALNCSICGKQVTAKTTIVVENHADHLGGFLCFGCRQRVFFGSPPKPPNLRDRIRSAAAFARGAIANMLRAIARIRFLPVRKRG